MPIRKKQQDRLWQFFADNPDEELTPDDVAAKLGCSRKAADMTILRMQAKGLLESPRVVRLTRAAKAAL